MKNFKAKKSLGQNFLEYIEIIDKIVLASGANAQSTILEIGPGKGALTEALLKTGARVVAVEKDDRAIEFLNEKFTTAITAGKFVLIHDDILEFDIEKCNAERNTVLPCGEYIIAANIPYYITGEFLRKFLETSCSPKKMVVMLQKEVAERIIGGSDGDKESILSISVKAYGKPEYVMTVPAEFFDPKPKVDSALLSIDSISKDFFTKNTISAISEEKFFKTVKTGFAHKRKVVIKNLEQLIPKETLDSVWNTRSLSPKIRAENLTLDDWRVIASNCD